jgi:hypothetical protein
MGKDLYVVCSACKDLCIQNGSGDSYIFPQDCQTCGTNQHRRIGRFSRDVMSSLNYLTVENAIFKLSRSRKKNGSSSESFESDYDECNRILSILKSYEFVTSEESHGAEDMWILMLD